MQTRQQTQQQQQKQKHIRDALQPTTRIGEREIPEADSNFSSPTASTLSHLSLLQLRQSFSPSIGLSFLAEFQPGTDESASYGPIDSLGATLDPALEARPKLDESRLPLNPPPAKVQCEQPTEIKLTAAVPATSLSLSFSAPSSPQLLLASQFILLTSPTDQAQTPLQQPSPSAFKQTSNRYFFPEMGNPDRPASTQSLASIDVQRANQAFANTYSTATSTSTEGPATDNHARRGSSHQRKRLSVTNPDVLENDDGTDAIVQSLRIQHSRSSTSPSTIPSRHSSLSLLPPSRSTSPSLLLRPNLDPCYDGSLQRKRSGPHELLDPLHEAALYFNHDRHTRRSGSHHRGDLAHSAPYLGSWTPSGFESGARNQLFPPELQVLRPVNYQAYPLEHRRSSKSHSSYVSALRRKLHKPLLPLFFFTNNPLLIRILQCPFRSRNRARAPNPRASRCPRLQNPKAHPNQVQLDQRVSENRRNLCC